MIKQRVKAFLNLKNQRNRLLAKNIAFTSLFQLGSVLMGVILLPISLSLLPAKVYGIWLTVSSMLMWLSYLDLGLGSGLKNKLSEAVALSDFKKAKKLISTAYFTIILIMIAVSLVFFLFSNSINYLKIFGNPDPTSISPKSLNNLINIVAYIFILRFIFQLINPILDSIQKLFWSKLIFFISQLIILGLLVFVKLFANPNIILLGIIYSLTPVCCLLIGTLIFFWKQKKLRPSIYFIDFGLIREIYSIGLRFLLIQLNMLVLFQSSNFIIINYIGSEDVVKYNIAFNLFSMMNIAFSTIASPYWSAYSSAWHQKDYSWITKAQKKLLFIWILIVSISGIVLIFSEYVYLIWIKNQVKIPFSLSLVLFIYMSLFCFGMIYNTFINSTGKILLQTVSLTILTLIYIPSVIYMIEKLHFGLNSIPIGLCLVASYTVIIAPWQSRRILSKTASGIVNR